MANKKVALSRCPICGKYPVRRKAWDEYKYFCGVHCSMGDWKHTQNAARRSWNVRVAKNTD